MNNLQKMGGIAALIEAATYLLGMVVAFIVLAPTWSYSPEQYVAFLVDNQTFLHLWHLAIYVINGVFLVVLVLGLNERLQRHSPALMQVATAVGLIWAGLVIASGMLIINNLGVVAEQYGQNPDQAVTIWLALAAVESGLGGAIELPGGLWLLLVSWAAWRGGELPRGLNILGMLVGAVGVVTAVPTLGELGAVFGLGCIAWFIWIGIFMLRRPVSQPITPSNPIAPHPSTVG